MILIGEKAVCVFYPIYNFYVKYVCIKLNIYNKNKNIHTYIIEVKNIYLFIFTFVIET